MTFCPPKQARKAGVLPQGVRTAEKLTVEPTGQVWRMKPRTQRTTAALTIRYGRKMAWLAPLSSRENRTPNVRPTLWKKNGWPLAVRCWKEYVWEFFKNNSTSLSEKAGPESPSLAAFNKMSIYGKTAVLKDNHLRLVHVPTCTSNTLLQV